MLSFFLHAKRVVPCGHMYAVHACEAPRVTADASPDRTLPVGETRVSRCWGHVRPPWPPPLRSRGRELTAVAGVRVV